MRIVRKLQPFFLLLALLLVLLLLRSQWDELRSHRWQLNPWWLAFSGAWLVAAWAVEIQLWRRLLRQVGGDLPPWQAARIWFLSAITRYIPGNIWQPLSMTLLCQQRGIAPEATLTSVALYQILILLAATPIAGVYFWLTGNWGLLTGLLQQWTPWLIGVGMAPVAIFVVRPAWLIDVVNWLLVRLRRPPLTAQLSRRDLLGYLLLAIVDWLLWGASFAALAFALEAYPAGEMARLAPHLVATYALAYTVGFVSLITPSGIGVREGALYLLLAPLLGGGAITLLALAMRLWTTLGELLAAAVAALVPGRRDLAPRVSPGEGELHKGLT